jgi:Domain of unknown function (DUF4411)
MAAGLPPYSVDTSSLIDGLERNYPEARFPSLWEKVEELIAAKRFLLSEEVWEEAQVKDAATRDWCSRHKKDEMVVPTDAAVTRAVQAVHAVNNRLVMNLKGRNRADPFVIAVASLYGAVVVTGEASSGTAERPRIPYVCGLMRIDCIRFLDLIKRENWSF